jgi:hypothetical protein
MKSIFFTIFISLFYAIGLGILGYAFWSARRSKVAANWPIAPGAIESCSLESSSDGDGGTTYEVKVRYRYTIHQKEYCGSRLAFGYSASSGQSAHEQLRSKLASCKVVDVRYDPTDPSISTLSFGLHRSIQFMFVFAITWLAFVIGFTVIWWVAARPDDVLLRNLIVR